MIAKFGPQEIIASETSIRDNLEQDTNKWQKSSKPTQSNYQDNESKKSKSPQNIEYNSYIPPSKPSSKYPDNGNNNSLNYPNYGPGYGPPSKPNQNPDNRNNNPPNYPNYGPGYGPPSQPNQNPNYGPG